MSVSPLSPISETAPSAKAANDGVGSASPYSDRPLAVHHHGDISVVVYSAPGQEPKRLNHPILPSLHIILVKEGEEIQGLTEVLASYLGESSAAPSAASPSAGTAEPDANRGESATEDAV